MSAGDGSGHLDGCDSIILLLKIKSNVIESLQFLNTIYTMYKI